MAKKMKYLSVCSGIEAAYVALHPLGFDPLLLSEIEGNPREVIKHRLGAHETDTPDRPEGTPLLHGDFTTDIAPILTASGRGVSRAGDSRGQDPLVPMIMAHGQANAEVVIDGSQSLTCNHEAPILIRMREGKEGGGKGPLVSEDQSLTLATANDQVLCFQGNASPSNSMNPGAIEPTIDKGKADGLCVAFSENQRGEVVESDIARAIQCAGGKPGQGYPEVRIQTHVRRLTPVEGMRLQGFPDTWCHIPTKKWRKIPSDEAEYLLAHGLHAEADAGGQWRTNVAADTSIYKAAGNSWTTNVVNYIGRRIISTKPHDTTQATPTSTPDEQGSSGPRVQELQGEGSVSKERTEGPASDHTDRAPQESNTL